MKRRSFFLSDLTPRVRNPRVRVRVIDMQPRQDGGNKISHQRITFIDQTGMKMTATLFGVDIDVYKDIIQRGKFYDITNATVKDVPERYASYIGEKQMYFTNATKIERVDVGESSSESSAVEYTISSIPSDFDDHCRFDMTFIVLSVGEEKTVVNKNGSNMPVREMYVTDDSTEQVLLVSAWNKLTLRQFGEMAEIMNEDPVVAVTAVRPSTFDRFSLATTLSSELLFRPTTERAVALRSWAAGHKVDLEHRLLSNIPGQGSYPAVVTPIALVLAKTVVAIGYTEVVKIEVRIPDFSPDHVNFTLGCMECGRNSTSCVTQVGEEFKCDFCLADTKAEPKSLHKECGEVISD